jgi:hypothetical protein
MIRLTLERLAQRRRPDAERRDTSSGRFELPPLVRSLWHEVHPCLAGSSRGNRGEPGLKRGGRDERQGGTPVRGAAEVPDGRRPVQAVGRCDPRVRAHRRRREPARERRVRDAAPAVPQHAPALAREPWGVAIARLGPVQGRGPPEARQAPPVLWQRRGGLEAARLAGDIRRRDGCLAQDAVGDRGLCLPVVVARVEPTGASRDAVGIDPGRKNTAVTSDGDRLAAGRRHRARVAKITPAQRRATSGKHRWRSRQAHGRTRLTLTLQCEVAQ